MNINGLGNLYDRTYETYRSSKYTQSFGDFLDKINENKGDISDMSVKESEEEKSDDKNDMLEEETRTEIVVRPDGSKVLMITVTVGGQEAVTSVELAKPTGEERALYKFLRDMNDHNCLLTRTDDKIQFSKKG